MLFALISNTGTAQSHFSAFHEEIKIKIIIYLIDKTHK